MTVEPLVRCDRLVVGFGRRALVPAFDLAIEPGEVVLVVGHNGCGKTTLVRTLLGLLRPVAGAVHLRAGLHCTYVPQATAIDALVPLQVQELVRWGAMRGWGFLRPWAPRRAESASGAAAAAAASGAAPSDAAPSDAAASGAAPSGGVPSSAAPSSATASGAVPSGAAPSIDALRRRRFGELSGGQRQRVLLARLLGGDAELAVLDEPTASMDGPTSEATFAALRRLAAERGTTSLVVSHAAGIAVPYVDRIVLLDPEGDGVLAGPAAEVAAAPRFRGLFGVIAISRAEAAGA